MKHLFEVEKKPQFFLTKLLVEGEPWMKEWPQCVLKIVLVPLKLPLVDKDVTMFL
jgi:hypothetical protein